MKQIKYFFLFVMLFFYLGTIFAQQQNIIVYYYPTCAGCKFVVDTIKNHGWDDRIKLIDATPKNEKENLRTDLRLDHILDFLTVTKRSLKTIAILLKKSPVLILAFMKRSQQSHIT